jgi:hypothetical protein
MAGVWCNDRQPFGSRTMLEEFLEAKVVIDLVSPYVCLGRLTRYDEHFLELKSADLHDLRDTDTTRELYVADSVATGIKRNRRRVLIRRSEVIAISRIEDVVDE